MKKIITMSILLMAFSLNMSTVNASETVSVENDDKKKQKPLSSCFTRPILEMPKCFKDR